MDENSWIVHFEMEGDEKGVQNLKRALLCLFFGLVWRCFVKA